MAFSTAGNKINRKQEREIIYERTEKQLRQESTDALGLLKK
jgi:hypothetical protein